MPSKGNKPILVRLPPDLAAWVDLRVAELAERSASPPASVPDYVRRCIERDRAHVERSRRPKPKRQG